MPTILDQFAIRPAQRNPRPDLLNPIGATSDEYAAAHPFAPSGWGPAAAVGNPSAAPGAAPSEALAKDGPSFASLSFEQQNKNANSGVYEPGSFGDQNNKANIGITSPGTFARQNAEANGTTFKDPVSGPGLKPAPTYPTAPEVRYNGVNGVGAPATGPAPARATRTLTQGQPMNLPAGPVFDLVGKGDSQPAAQPSRSGQSLALSALLGGYGTPPEQARGEGRHSGTVDPLNALGNTGMVLNAARGVDALRTQTGAEQDLKLLDRAGMIPQANDTPEVRSNKLAYLDQRVREQASGKTSRAPGSPVYTGGPALSKQSASNGPSIADMAGLANRITATAGTKPMPGSAGYGKTEVPGIGTIVRDNATGEPIGSGSIIKPEETKDKPPTEAQVTFDSNLDVAMQKLDEFEKTVKKYGNFETGVGDPTANAALSQLPYQLAVLTAKIVDPATAAREGEVASAQKYILPAGFFTNNTTTLAAIKNLRNTFEQYGKARGKAQAIAAPVPHQAATAEPAASSALAPGTITPAQAKAELARRRGLAPKK